MKVIHFTPGSMDPETAHLHGAVECLPIATTIGDGEVSGLYLAPGTRAVAPSTPGGKIYLVVNGKVLAFFSGVLKLDAWAGTGLVLGPDDECIFSSDTGAVVIVIEAHDATADPCGISSPARVVGKLWPVFENN